MFGRPPVDEKEEEEENDPLGPGNMLTMFVVANSDLVLQFFSCFLF